MMSPGILQGDQVTACQAIFGDRIRDQSERLQSAMDHFLKKQEQELVRAAERSDLGPAVRELSRLLIGHPISMLQVTFDLDASQPPKQTAMDPGFASLLSTLESQPGMGAGLANLMRGFAAQAAQPASSMIELSINLPTDFVMWGYSGSVGTKRIESGPWPNALFEPLEEWPGAKPRLESVAILKPGHGKLEVAQKSPLKAAVVAALAEIYELENVAPVASDPLDDVRGGADGVARWNAKSDSERQNAGPFKKADLSGAVLDDAKLSWLDFSRANFDGARLRNVLMTKTKFSQATFRNATIEEGDTTSAIFKGCDFSGADLRKAVFYLADLSNANFTGADLRGATFSMSKVKGANFSTDRIEGIQFFNWTDFDEKTVFPEGFKLPGSQYLKWNGTGRDPRE